MTSLFLFFILCLVLLVIVMIYFKEARDRKNFFILFMLGLVFGYLMEYWGVSTGNWSYEGTDTIWMVSEIAFEVVFAYGVALMLAGVLIVYVFRGYNEEDRLKTITKALPILATITLAISVMNGYPIGIGLTLFAVWGIIISQKKSIPLIVGLVAFFMDIVIEGWLTATDNYYVWSAGIPLGFLLAGIAFGGWMTRKTCTKDDDLCFVEA